MHRTCSSISKRIFPILLLAAGASGCLQPGTGSTSFENTGGFTGIIPPGPKAAQVIFTDLAGSGAGSFNAPPASGTVAGAGSGLQAMQLFNPDGSRLTLSSTGGTSDPNWPAWLSSVEIGISGASNAVATSPNCANFGTGTAVCGNLPSGSAGCDVANTYGISEKDCDTAASGQSWGSGNATGNGTSADGVYIRANFNRASLGSIENIMVVLNYAASAFNPATTNPASCFSGGAVPFSPENCADFTWRVFQTYSPAGTFVQPFLMLVPPMYSYVIGNTTASTTSATKQFIIPFAGDPRLSTIVFGRTGAQLNTGTTGFSNDCNVTGGSGGSPLCAGIVFYSMTFFRI